MNTDSIKFRVKGNNVTVSGYPELEGLFAYIGANQDVEAVAATISMQRKLTRTSLMRKNS